MLKKPKGVCVMRINPVSSVNYYGPKQAKIHSKQNCVQIQQPSFQGKHSSAKFWGGLFGTVGTLGAVIYTGGAALPFVIGYGALSAWSGAILGHIIDKGAEKAEKEMQQDKKVSV